jgi:hypothetical protein
MSRLYSFWQDTNDASPNERDIQSASTTCQALRFEQPM